MKRIVIVGYGMVGARLAEELRHREPDPDRLRVTVLGAEPHLAYNRVLLSAVLAGDMPEASVRLHDAGWAREHHVAVHTGAEVSTVDTERRVVRTAAGEEFCYDELVLATGAGPWLPPVRGLTTTDGSAAAGVTAFRNLDDCARILDMARPGSEVAVLGGGLLGIEAARGLAGRGMRVTVLHPVGHLMERQLDPGAGAVLAGSLAGLGVDVRLGVSADSWHPGHGVLLDDGTTVPAQAVVVSAGVRPETGLAEAAGLKVDRGVLVDDRLCTSDPRVYAIGDCARHAAGGAGLVQPGWEQAAVLADVLSCADPWARYRGTPSITRLKARGVDLAALGDVHAQDGEVLSFADSARGRYAKLVLADDRVRGAILLGLPDAAATIVQLYDRGAPAPADRLALLFGRALPDEVVRAESPAQMPDKSIVCRCNTVTKKALTVAWRSGAQDVPALGRATRAGTGCGSCGDVVQGICEWLAATETADAGGAAEREGAA